MKVIVSSASRSPLLKNFPLTLDLAPSATVADVKAAIAAKAPKLSASRQKISVVGDKKPLADDSPISVTGTELAVKDLGPQVSWKTVFLVEYAGPLIIHPLVFHLPRLFYGNDVKHSNLQIFVYAFVVLHFLKRELETLFVHRFSHATMPLGNIFKNSAHYHLFSGLALAYDVYRPKYGANSPYVHGTVRDSPEFLWVGAAVWLFAELSNLHTHLTLRNLRAPGSRERKIPRGYGFTWVSVPNYFFETIAWLVICFMTNSIAAWVFTVIAVGQMGLWAVKKHQAYRKEFGTSYPRGRKAMIPFVF
ncbi:hypothetical protein HGRIS_009366 [Hohenbuehelia grisea]|uniref:3-oxo-5-alpha-steroid 4-dehydrogenase C-terminal domain-containing protein n=1 Tax=Hohenbuehelia grisea TaxID=104357 RepID=A0ABR3J1A8_9AGAR